MRSTNPGTCFFLEQNRRQAKTATARTDEHNLFVPNSKTYPSPSKHIQGHPNQSKPQIGLAEIPRCPSFEVKTISNPKDDETQNDAKVNIYPLECPKPIILLKKHVPGFVDVIYVIS